MIKRLKPLDELQGFNPLVPKGLDPFAPKLLVRKNNWVGVCMGCLFLFAQFSERKV